MELYLLEFVGYLLYMLTSLASGCQLRDTGGCAGDQLRVAAPQVMDVHLHQGHIQLRLQYYPALQDGYEVKEFKIEC